MYNYYEYAKYQLNWLFVLTILIKKLDRFVNKHNIYLKIASLFNLKSSNKSVWLLQTDSMKMFMQEAYEHPNFNNFTRKKIA